MANEKVKHEKEIVYNRNEDGIEFGQYLENQE